MAEKIFATLIIKNASIWTIDENSPRAEYVAIYLDTIMRVGYGDDFSDLVGQNTIVIDANGRSVIPGFIDAHTHIAWNGLNKVYLDLSQTKSIEEVVDLVKKEVEKKQDGEWIIGRAWDQSKWINQRYLTAADLDPVSPKNPVKLRHVSGHFETVNTLGFQRLGLSKIQLGVDLDENGEVIGTLRDVDLKENKETRPTFDDFIQGFKLGFEEAIELGITSVHDNITFETLPVYLHLARNNLLKVRVYGIIYEDMIDEAIKIGLDRNFGDKWFKIGAVKLMTDGAISSRTAYVFDEYDDKPNEYGFALYDEEKLDIMVSKVHQANLQIAAHAIGDKANANLITAIEKNIEPSECKEALHRIEHAEILRKEDVLRAAKLGLVFSMQPNFVWRWGLVDVDSMYEQRLGKERTMINNPFRWILDENLILAFGSDGMPLGPLYGMKGALFHPNQELRLSLEEAIRSYTLHPAKAIKEENIKGSIVEGKLADLVMLSHNLDVMQEEDFHNVTVDYTIIGGEIKYQRV